jgi:AraC-like DNA-binding protein
MHLVFCLADVPLRLFEDADGAPDRTVGHSVVGGSSSRFFVRDVSRPIGSVGAMLHPGAAELLFREHADALAERHTSLEDLWGRWAREARERIVLARGPSAKLALFEALLASRVPKVRAIPPAVAAALARFVAASDPAGVRGAVQDSGHSHRHFVTLFRRTVGLAPKVHCRVLRFQRVLARLGQIPPQSRAPWAAIALDAGYADQSHMNREFRAFAGLTPGEYRLLAPASSHHVPMVEPAQVNFVQDGGAPPRQTPRVTERTF